MRTLFIPFIFLLSLMRLNAQSTSFETAYASCQKAVSALSDGSGSQTEMREAAKMLKSTNWSAFSPIATDGQKEAEIGQHLLFTEEYFLALADGHSVKKVAKEYETGERGSGDVHLCTKVIKGGSTRKYAFNCVGGKTLKVGVVAEVNGLINLKIVAKKKGSNDPPIERKENSNENKGAPYRQLDIELPKGQYIITLEITNKYKKDRSCAILAN